MNRIAPLGSRRAQNPADCGGMWERKGWLFALLIVAAGVWLRIDWLGDYWVNADEGLYDYIAHAPLELARVPIAQNAHPPLYFWLLRGVGAIFEDFVWLRVPALLCGAAGIFATYRLGREVSGELAGITGAAVMALSPGAIALSSVIRPYAFQNWMLAAALLFIVRYLRTRRRRDLIWYTSSMLVAMLLHYGTFVVVSAVALLSIAAAVTRRLEAREIRDLCYAQLPLGLAATALYAFHIAPNLMGEPIQLDAVRGWLAPQFSANAGDLWRSFVGVFDFLFGVPVAFAGIVAFVGGLAACVVQRRPALVVLCAGAMSTAIVLSIFSLYPFGATRHSFYLAPLVFSTIGCGVAFVVARGLLATTLASAAAAALVVGSAPSAAFLGLAGDRPEPPSELGVPRAEVESLHEALVSVTTTPGLLFVDLETVYMLSPLLRAANAWPRWTGSPPVAVYHWGDRRVMTAPVWRFDGETGFRGSRPHLSRMLSIAAKIPEFAPLLEIDVVVISTRGDRTLASIRRLATTPEHGREIVDSIATAEHFAILRLDSVSYREALSQRRKALPEKRGQRAIGVK